MPQHRLPEQRRADETEQHADRQRHGGGGRRPHRCRAAGARIGDYQHGCEQHQRAEGPGGEHMSTAREIRMALLRDAAGAR
ncbi:MULTISPECIES: hypothetical protein [Actinoalloteichus]|uniref:hypothetical protein n=1 Tax=Actinoalloteichus TaxID=65496 RepID=UPI0009535185|nr:MULTISPECIES: hypothetical protein [Actinoalloteichus]